ncbi:hypothetical protein F5884DRAFT_842710 [Xylogone sp. PMI_703]|nr:hypothetical protein F5884DRAFT_842710 [Xylogone sp. PMI_703]
MTKLFTPVQVGKCPLKHRIVMAPMTRRRGLETLTPSDLMIEYYSQRASIPGTLLISEATSVSPRSAAQPNTPGLYTEEHISGWRAVTDAVHAKGSYIFAQLWITGRAAKAGAVKRGAEIVSCSDIPAGPDSIIPRPLVEEEIYEFIDAFKQASINAVKAGFDGVELHGANGYLIDQFTQDVSNRRTDGWGGSIEKRSRFGVEVARAVVEAIGAERVGYRISPWSTHQGMRMADPIPQFTHLIGELRKLKLAYLHVIEARVKGNADIDAAESIDVFVEAWGNATPVIVAGGYTGASSQQTLDEKYKDKDVLVAFGRNFISNPDLPYRLQHDLAITKYNRDLFYEVLQPKGYIDYEPSMEFLQQQAVPS